MSEQSETTGTLSDIPQGWAESVYAKVNGILGEWCRQSGCVWIKTPEDWVRALPDGYVNDVKIIDVYDPDTHKAVQRGQAVPHEAAEYL